MASAKINAAVATLLASLFCAQVAAVPTAKRQAITTLGTAQIDAFTPYTHFASTAYCSPASTLAWNCGTNCQANPSFEPVASGGDGDETQFCALSSESLGSSLYPIRR